MTDSNIPFHMPHWDLPSETGSPRLNSRNRSWQRDVPPRRPRGCYWVRDPADFVMRKFATPENLNLSFEQLIREGGSGAGIDGFGPDRFSSHERWPILRQICAALMSGTYYRYPSRTVEVPRSKCRVRILHLMRFTDRCVAKALLNCMSDFWRRRSIAMSVQQIYTRLNREIRRRRVYYLAIDDIRDCFPSAPLDEVVSCQRLRIQSEPLVQLITRVIRCRDDAGRIGLEQGSPYSPIAMDALLHHHLDQVMRTRGSGFGTLYRYVDNLTFLCRGACEGRRLIELAQEQLTPLGFKLKGQSEEWGDIRDPNFQTTLLGLIPRWQNGHLTFSIPESAFNNLESLLRTCTDFSQPSYRAERCCIGWIQAYGLALNERVARMVSHRVSQMAVRYGFRSLARTVLLRESNRAYQNGMQFLNGSDSV